jgi:DNA-binding NarL/FixJ family response regulator
MSIPQTVLLVDDEVHIRVLLRRVLGQLGVPFIFEAKDGQEACSLYAQHRPEVVLMDINMPLMSGVEALEKITEADPQATVVMLTSLGSRQAVERCADGGAMAYLRKDIPLNELSERLRKTFAELEGE